MGKKFNTPPTDLRMALSMSGGFTLFRKPTDAERRLLVALIDKVDNLNLPTNWLELLEVQQMNDSGMGSLRLFFHFPPIVKQTFGRQASELMFEDADGVKVIASLNLDSSNIPMELDLWKTDFSPLIRIPVSGGLIKLDRGISYNL